MSRHGITFDTTHARQLLDSGLQEMQLNAHESERIQLINYLALMAKWNPVYNLTAIRETHKMVSHHLLDSIAAIDVFRKSLNNNAQPNVLDVGTGGGLPGVVLAITNPSWQLTLIDPVHKKTAFLTQVKAQLNLNNLTIVTGKVEDLSPSIGYDCITSRAFASLIDFVQLSQQVLKADGTFIAMKGVAPHEELIKLKQLSLHAWQSHIIPLQVPQLDAERHLIQLWRTSNTPF